MSEIYDRNFENIFEIQSEIATQIARALEVELLPDELQRIEDPLTASTEAYAYYLKAAAITIIPPTPRKDLIVFHDSLDSAIELDPTFSRAHALKAFDYIVEMNRFRSRGRRHHPSRRRSLAALC